MFLFQTRSHPNLQDDNNAVLGKSLYLNIQLLPLLSWHVAMDFILLCFDFCVLIIIFLYINRWSIFWTLKVCTRLLFYIVINTLGTSIMFYSTVGVYFTSTTEYNVSIHLMYNYARIYQHILGEVYFTYHNIIYYCMIFKLSANITTSL